jgi:predicted transcriptional regulator of viral defense system
MASEAHFDLPNAFTHADAIAHGISDRRLAQLHKDGVIDRLARGIYLKPDVDIDPDLAEITVRAPRATLCLTTALARHDLIDDIPPSINTALPRRQRPPRTAAPVTWHRFDEATFDIGRTEIVLTDQLSIGIYDPLRSIIDAYRLRHLYGIDQAHEALKRWLRQRGTQPAALLAMTKHFPKAEPILRTSLETLL